MPQFFSNKRLILLLVGVIVLVALISFSLKDRQNATLPEQIIKDVVGFGQSVFSKPAQYITGVIGNIDGILNTYEENKQLKSRLSEYAAGQVELTDIREENKRLLELIGKEDNLRQFDSIHATVISRNPDQWEEKVIVDKGKADGVEKNMAVITADGLIGKVILVTRTTSTVELLSTENLNSRVASVIADEDPVYGLTVGFDKERSELIMKRIETNTKIKVGGKVESSGLGGIFPKGLLIGEVTEVSTDDYGLTKLVYVRPAAKFTLLDHVVIVKRKSVTADGTDGSDTAGAEADEKVKSKEGEDES